LIVDTSALIAILRAEPRHAVLEDAFASSERRLISAGTLLEAVIVAAVKKGPQGPKELFALVDVLGLDVKPVERVDADIAAEAFTRYGKGQGHPAQLNFGDCFTYALAKRLSEPVLCTGDDFLKTDLAVLPLRG
jgi:ribonuclease VapC